MMGVMCGRTKTLGLFKAGSYILLPVFMCWRRYELTIAVQLIVFLKKQISDSRRPKVHNWLPKWMFSLALVPWNEKSGCQEVENVFQSSIDLTLSVVPMGH
ncbi:hypothetical protein Tco_1163168 [Tanacetum coccineum]